MVYFSVGTPDATLDQVLNGTVSDAPPTTGSYMDEFDFGTVVTVGGATKKYTTFSGYKGADYFDAMSNAVAATITADGYFVVGGYVWLNGSRLSTYLGGRAVAILTLYDSSNTVLGRAYQDSRNIVSNTSQAFDRHGKPLNGAFLVGPQIGCYYVGNMLLTDEPSFIKCYDASFALVSGAVMADKGQLVVPSGTKYVVAANSGACVVDGSRVLPLPFGVDYTKLGVAIVSSAGLRTNFCAAAASPNTFAGPWYDADGKPAKGNVGDYYFDLQGFSSYQPTAPYTALYSSLSMSSSPTTLDSSPTTVGVFYAPADAHFAKMLTIPANTNTPFAADLAGNVGVSAKSDASAKYVKAQPITVTVNGAPIDTYADSASKPTVVLLPNGMYSIGTVTGFKVLPGSAFAASIVSRVLSWQALAVALVILLAVLGYLAVTYYKHHRGPISA